MRQEVSTPRPEPKLLGWKFLSVNCSKLTMYVDGWNKHSFNSYSVPFGQVMPTAISLWMWLEQFSLFVSLKAITADSCQLTRDVWGGKTADHDSFSYFPSAAAAQSHHFSIWCWKVEREKERMKILEISLCTPRGQNSIDLSLNRGCCLPVAHSKEDAGVARFFQLNSRDLCLRERSQSSTTWRFLGHAALAHWSTCS